MSLEMLIKLEVCYLFNTFFYSSADVTYSFDQVVNTNSPESCWTYLKSLEKRGNPHTDVNLLNKLKDCYSKIFSRLPIRQFSKNTTYARILVRYAELKGWVWIMLPVRPLDLKKTQHNCRERITEDLHFYIHTMIPPHEPHFVTLNHSIQLLKSSKP